MSQLRKLRRHARPRVAIDLETRPLRPIKPVDWFRIEREALGRMGRPYDFEGLEMRLAGRTYKATTIQDAVFFDEVDRFPHISHADLAERVARYAERHPEIVMVSTEPTGRDTFGDFRRWIGEANFRDRARGWFEKVLVVGGFPLPALARDWGKPPGRTLTGREPRPPDMQPLAFRGAPATLTAFSFEQLEARIADRRHFADEILGSPFEPEAES